jgi:FixJ family two-component response regulator
MLEVWLMVIVPSLFGRELVEQVAADKTAIPVIVLKSISAVEAVGAF